MLTIREVPGRPEQEGRYLVSVWHYADAVDSSTLCRLAYYCDRAHLVQMLKEILRALGVDVASGESWHRSMGNVDAAI